MKPQQREPNVSLVCLPWTTLAEPCLGLGILRAVLQESSIQSRVHHFHIELLRWLSPQTYFAIANVFALNDFLFTGVLDGAVTVVQRQILREKALEMMSAGVYEERHHWSTHDVVEKLLELRNHVIPAWLSELADRLLARSPTLVGFTCMFDQTIASIALAKLVKDRSPETMIVLGGYAVRSPTAEMLMDAFPWLDAICVGEGEPAITGLARSSVGRQSLGEVPNLISRDCNGVRAASRFAPAVDLESVPTPCYDDFFEDIEAFAEQHSVDILPSYLPVENSRGCWWGAVHHCVFCGIHEEDLKYRSRSSARVLAVLESLATRHHVTKFRFSDYILPHEYHRTLVPELISHGAPYEIACEIKANLTHEQARNLARAGFVEVQPGVESFISGVLRRMDKGVSAIQNIHTLLLGKRYGIHIAYNILYGMPEDTEAEYAALLPLLPRLIHLDAPSTRVPVQVTRYAPLHTNPEQFGLPAHVHERSYTLVFSKSFIDRFRFDLDVYCYYFERKIETSPRLERLFWKLEEAIDQWKASHHERPPTLTYFLAGADLVVEDNRGIASERYVLSPSAARLLLACEAPIHISRLTHSVPDFDVAMAALDSLGLVFADDGKVVSLVLPRADQDVDVLKSLVNPAVPSEFAVRRVHLPVRV